MNKRAGTTKKKGGETRPLQDLLLPLELTRFFLSPQGLSPRSRRRKGDKRGREGPASLSTRKRKGNSRKIIHGRKWFQVCRLSLSHAAGAASSSFFFFGCCCFFGCWGPPPPPFFFPPPPPAAAPAAAAAAPPSSSLSSIREKTGLGTGSAVPPRRPPQRVSRSQLIPLGAVPPPPCGAALGSSVSQSVQMSSQN